MPPRAGRPPATSVEQIVVCAYDLFLRAGYDETTFDELAAAIGVSRRTLFHYFPSKERIVWHDHEATLESLRRGLRTQDGARAPFAAMRAAIVAALTIPDSERPALRQRFLLVARTPSLRASYVFDDWRNVLAADAARRLREKPMALRPQLLAGAAQSATMSALTRWAGEEGGAPEQVVDDALALVGAGLIRVRRVTR